MKHIISIISITTSGYAEATRVMTQTIIGCVTPAIEAVHELAEGLENDKAFQDAMNTMRNLHNTAVGLMPPVEVLTKGKKAVRKLKRLFDLNSRPVQEPASVLELKAKKRK